MVGMDKAAIQKLFNLARISITEADLSRFSSEFSDILQYAEKLKEAPLEDIPPTLSMAYRSNVFRDDYVALHGSKKLIAEQFPESKNGYLKTKNVFEAK